MFGLFIWTQLRTNMNIYTIHISLWTLSCWKVQKVRNFAWISYNCWKCIILLENLELCKHWTIYITEQIFSHHPQANCNNQGQGTGLECNCMWSGVQLGFNTLQYLLICTLTIEMNGIHSHNVNSILINTIHYLKKKILKTRVSSQMKM